MSATNKRGQGVDGSTIALLIAVIAVLVILGSVWVAVALGSQLDGVNEGRTSDPFEVFFGVIRGTVTWPGSATGILAAILVVIATLAVMIGVSITRARRRRSAVDSAARHMGKGKQLRSLSATGALQTAQRLGVHNWVGVLIGITVAGRRRIYASPEDMVTLIAGPRVGKSTGYVIPAIADAPGAVLTTSNKRDVLDATRELRTTKGRVWAFDPQNIAEELPVWWWNPLSYVTDDVKAAKLAAHFAAGSRAGDSRGDAYFDCESVECLLAA